MQAAEPKDLNPYVAVVAKKYRNLKKKLEKITKAETQLAQGKVLDEEQKILLSSKKAIEKSVAEILNIKQQLEEVAKAEEEAVKTVQPEPVSQPTETVTVVEEVEETLPVTESVEVATHTEATEQLVASTMTEPEEEVEVPPPQPQVDLKAFLEVSLERFVKALHVYERYENVTSNPLPDNVSYFGKTLLGLTSISSFQETVNNSLRTATFYLNEELASSNDIVRGTNYVRLGQQIDALVEEMERVQQRGTNNALTALLRTTIANSSSSAALNNTHNNAGNGNASPAAPVVSAPVPAPAEPVYDSSLYAAHDSFNSGLQFGNHGLVNFGHHQGYYASQQPAEPVFVAPSVTEVYHAPVELSASPSVPIAPTLPDLVVIEEEPVHEEQQQVEEPVVPAVSEEVVEEVVEEEVREEAAATSHQEQQPAGGRRQDKGAKNIRVRGDRATRPRPEPKAAPAAPVVEAKKEPPSFKDRLVSGKAPAPTPAPAPSVAAEAAAAVPVVAESAAPVATEETSNGNKKTKPARKEKKSGDVEGEAAAVDASEPATASAVKNKRERRERSPRKEHKDTAPAEAEAPKKTSYLSAIAGASSSTAPSSAPAAVEPATGADAKRNEVRRERAPRKPAAEATEGSETAPRGPRSSSKPTYNNTSSTSSGNFRERREKKAESTPVSAPAAAPAEDGFQQVSRRSAPSADKKPSSAVHKPRPAGAVSSSNAPRAPKPAAATSSAK